MYRQWMCVEVERSASSDGGIGESCLHPREGLSSGRYRAAQRTSVRWLADSNKSLAARLVVLSRQ
jgi:hypothetical protein